MIIKKKTWPVYFERVLSGKKKFDIRLGDFEIKEGDTLVLEEWDPETKSYTGRKIEKKVGYVVNTKNEKVWSKEDIDKYGLWVIGMEDLEVPDRKLLNFRQVQI